MVNIDIPSVDQEAVEGLSVAEPGLAPDVLVDEIIRIVADGEHGEHPANATRSLVERVGERLIKAASGSGEQEVSVLGVNSDWVDQLTYGLGIAAYGHEVRQNSNIDDLTGLPNRNGWNAKIEEAEKLRLNNDRRGVKTGYVAMIVDANGLKRVNDETCDHAAGDDLLQEMAIRLAYAVRDEDFVARLGGDEFAILFQYHYADTPDEQALVERLEKQVSSASVFTLTANGKEFPVSASVGAAVVRSDKSIPDALSDADGRMYDAKKGHYKKLQEAS